MSKPTSQKHHKARLNSLWVNNLTCGGLGRVLASFCVAPLILGAVLMKFFHVSLSLALLSLSCGGDNSKKAPNGNPDTPDNKDGNGRLLL